MPPDPLAMETSVRRQNRWVWTVSFAILAVLIVIPYVIVTVYDAPAPDDDAMVPEWPAATPGDQPLATFLETARQLELFETMAETKDKPLAGIEPPSPIFAALDKLLAADPQTWAWPDGIKQEKMLESDLQALDQLEALKTLLMRRARHASASGHAVLAAGDCIRLVRLGHGLGQTRTTAMRLSTAAKYQQHGMAMLEHFITDSSITPDQLKETLADLLMLQGPSRESCRFACRVQYQNLRHLLQDTATQDAVLKELERHPPWRNEIKVHQTLSTWLSDLTPVYDGLASNWPATVSALRPSVLAPAKRTTWERQLIELRRNRAGSIYGPMMSPLFMVRDVIHFKTVHSQATIMLAMRLHELKHGRLPDHLDQLAPDILPMVPLDVYTGRPFHWSAPDRHLYSEGMNAIDNGGTVTLHSDILSPRKPPHEQPSDDLGQYYWWSEEARDHRTITIQQEQKRTPP